MDQRMMAMAIGVIPKTEDDHECRIPSGSGGKRAQA